MSRDDLENNPILKKTLSEMDMSKAHNEQEDDEDDDDITFESSYGEESDGS